MCATCYGPLWWWMAEFFKHILFWVFVLSDCSIIWHHWLPGPYTITLLCMIALHTTVAVKLFVLDHTEMSETTRAGSNWIQCASLIFFSHAWHVCASVWVCICVRMHCSFMQWSFHPFLQQRRSRNISNVLTLTRSIYITVQRDDSLHTVGMVRLTILCQLWVTIATYVIMRAQTCRQQKCSYVCLK